MQVACNLQKLQVQITTLCTFLQVDSGLFYIHVYVSVKFTCIEKLVFHHFKGILFSTCMFCKLRTQPFLKTPQTSIKLHLYQAQLFTEHILWLTESQCRTCIGTSIATCAVCFGNIYENIYTSIFMKYKVAHTSSGTCPWSKRSLSKYFRGFEA